MFQCSNLVHHPVTLASTLYRLVWITMPKSKRDKRISLTRVEKKKGLETKAALVDKVRSAVDSYAR